jgi:hypothetical protein
MDLRDEERVDRLAKLDRFLEENSCISRGLFPSRRYFSDHLPIGQAGTRQPIQHCLR